VSKDDFDNMVLRLKTVTTGTEKLNMLSSTCKVIDATTKSRYSRFLVNGTNLASFNPTIGNYYKVQLAFANNIVGGKPTE
jgi:hypothetical protein